jgi:hypothetical protein
LNETDPVFVAQNGSIWNAINDRMLITDQRYNDSGRIDSLNSTTLKTAGAQLLMGDLTVAGNLNVIGQMVNLTVQQQLVNGSILPTISGLFTLGNPTYLWGGVYAADFYGNLNASFVQNAPWLLATDQRYNDTGYVASYIASINLTNGTNGIDGLNGTGVNMSQVINNGNGTYTWVFSDGFNFTTGNLTGEKGDSGLNVTYNITYNITTQYNDSNLTALISAVNTTGNIQVLGFNTTSQLYTQFLNITDQRYNNTIRSYNLTMTVMGNGTNTSSALLNYAIKQFIVTSATNTTTFNFAAAESPSGTVIDRDRATHTGLWNIRKDYAINSAVLVNISNASVNEQFTVTIKYLNNDAP